MKIKIFFSFLFIVFAIFLLLFYWFIPLDKIEFSMAPRNYNFTIEGIGEDNMQFYDNMRYSSSQISYKIYDCPLQRQNDMERAFEIIEEETILRFYEIDFNEEISVRCEDENRVEEGLFIAGEGGPTRTMIDGKNFNVIFSGEILLLKDSKCERPNVALHELLHALGFDHSKNPNNIMYNISKCQQTIGEDIVELINYIYSFESLPDLDFEKAAAIKHGIYLDINMTFKNNGLANSPAANILVYADNKLVEEVQINTIEIGEGRIIGLTNVNSKQTKVEELKLIINSSFDELDKTNNEIILDIN